MTSTQPYRGTGGGLGIRAVDTLHAAAGAGGPMLAVTLLYRKGLLSPAAGRVRELARRASGLVAGNSPRSRHGMRRISARVDARRHCKMTKPHDATRSRCQTGSDSETLEPEVHTPREINQRVRRLRRIACIAAGLPRSTPARPRLAADSAREQRALPHPSKPRPNLVAHAEHDATLRHDRRPARI
jgi:hypothetical protein